MKNIWMKSDIPIIVDVIDWHAISDEFRTIIENNYEIIQEKR
jgi:hypothetical protein